MEGDLETEVKVIQDSDYIEPSFNIRELKKKLLDAALTTKQRLKLLLGLHYKMRHLGAIELKRMLLKGGYGKENADLADQVIKNCSVCQQWKQTITKPVSGGGILATFFNERLVTDLFSLWGRTYVIYVDECIRYAVAAFIGDKKPHTWYTVFVANWVRYFGPCMTLVSDQEGAVVSDMISRACEAFDINRDLGGSEGHTKTGLAERRLGIVKLGALKLWHQVQKQGLKLSQDECVIEACMVTNSTLVYGSATPNQALLGFEPRDTYDLENKSHAATSTASAVANVDFIESTIRGRLLAKEAIIQAIIEHRIAESANSKTQQVEQTTLAKLSPGSQIDLWREPEAKDQTGWKGPGEMLKLYREDGKAVIMWRGVPMLLPLRHVRPHVGFVWLLSSVFNFSSETDNNVMTVLKTLMDLVENFILGQLYTYGRVWNDSSMEFNMIPPDLETNPPEIYVKSSEIASKVLGLPKIDGVQFGTGVKRTDAIQNTTSGKLVVWDKLHRSN